MTIFKIFGGIMSLCSFASGVDGGLGEMEYPIHVSKVGNT